MAPFQPVKAAGAFIAVMAALLLLSLSMSSNVSSAMTVPKSRVGSTRMARMVQSGGALRSFKAAGQRNPTRVFSSMPAVGDKYEVNLEKPLGLGFARGNDGGAYIIKVDGRKGNVDPRCEIGDKMVEISASFGDEVWTAENFGQIMYAIRTRNGGLFFKFEKRDGDMSFLEMDTKDREFKKERNGGNYGAGTREVQMRNYITSKENERVRMDLFNQGLADYKSGNYENAVFKFEDVLGMEPPNYVGDNFARITPVYEVASYNIACCYSKMKNTEACLSAFNDALNAGYDDFEKVRTAEGLKEIREAEPEKFNKILNRYDEPVFDPKLVEGFKNFFGIGKK